jgi:phosphatidylinositol alpha-mannosyltransferase
MKIGIVTEYYYPTLGGIQEHVHHFALEAMARGHQVRIITSHVYGIPEDRKKTDAIPTTRIGIGIPLYQNGAIGRVTFDPFLGNKLQRLFDQQKFDIIHIHVPITPCLPLIALSRSNTVTVGTIHTNFKWNPWFKIFHKACQRLVDRLDGLIAVSKTAIAALNQHFKTTYRIIPNGIDTTQFNPGIPRLPQFTDGRFNLLWIGRMEPRNGLDRMINAFAAAWKVHNDLRLIVIGDGPLRSAYQDMIPAHIKPFVTFTGFVNEGRPALFSSADVLCVPATISSFGITLLEGMASGKPIIASDIDGFRDVMTNGHEGMLIDTKDPLQFRDAILTLAANRALAMECGQRGLKTAEKYSWPKVTEQILEYYQEATNRFNGRSSF